MKLSLYVVENNKIIVEHSLLPGAKNPSIQAKVGQAFILRDSETGRAPQCVMVQRKGKTLILRQGTAPSSVTIVELDDFYAEDDKGHALIGLDERDLYYHYISTNAQPGEMIAGLADGQTTLLSLGGASLGDGGLYTLAAVPLLAGAPGMYPWLLGAGLGAGAIAAAAGAGGGGGGGGDSSDPAPAPAPAPAQAMPTSSGVQGVTDHVGPKQGNIDFGGLTDDARPTFNGMGTPGNTITIIDNGKPIGQATVRPDGTWSFRPDQPLADGSHEMTTTQTDLAGQTSVPSKPYPITVDTIPPGAPSMGLAIDNIGAILGEIANKGITDDAQPELTGTAEAGSVVVIYDRQIKLGVTVAGVDGKWRFTPEVPLSLGEHSFTSTATDAAGNTSEASAVYSITVVSDAPPVPPVIVTVYDDVFALVGALQNEQSTNDTTPTINGTAQSGSVIRIYDNGTLLGSTTADVNGNWSFTPSTALSEGRHALTADAVNATTGNASAQTSVFAVVVDVTAPDAPGAMSAWDNVGAVQGLIANNSTTDDATPTFRGQGTPGDQMTIIDKGNVIGQTTVNNDGSWSFTPALPLVDGIHQITVTATDPAGNTSSPSPSLTFTIEAAAVVVMLNAPYDDVGIYQGPIAQNGVTDDSRPMFSGQATAGSTVDVYDTFNGGATRKMGAANRMIVKIGTVVADEFGNWALTPETALLDGAHSITVTSTYQGKTSAPTSPYGLIVDTSSPAAPSMGLALDDVGVIQGDIADKGITDDAQPELRGTAEAGSLVIIYDHQIELGRTVARADGTWRLTPKLPLALGEHSFTSTATDAAGNTGEVSAAYSFTVVSDAIPQAPAIVTVYDNVLANLGYLQKEQVTNDSTPEISGTAQAGLTVRIYDNNTLLGSTRVDQYGNWSFTPTTPLTQGRHVFTADAINLFSGAVSDKTGDFAVVIDVTAPAAPEAMTALDNVGAEQGWIANNSITDDATPTLSGTGTEGDLITIFDLGTSIGSALVNKDGVWFFTPEPSLIDGLHRITSTATDPAGNTSEQSPSLDFTVDTSAVVIALDAVYDDVGMYQGPIALNGVTDDNLPRISGKATPGSTVDVYDTVDGVSTKIGTVGVNALGNWVLTPATALVDGQHRITATSTYLGNVSAPTSAFDFTVDTTAPAKPGSGTGGISNVYDDVGSVQGYVAPNGVTDDATPTFSGTGTAGDLITIHDDGTVIGTAIVKPDGSWSFTPSTPLTEGLHDITTTVTDPAGNTSVPSDPYPIIIDTTSPAAPSMGLALDDVGSILGEIADQGITDDAQPELKGTAEAGSLVIIYDHQVELGRTVARADGTWRLTPELPLALGKHSFTSTATDIAGNTSAVSSVYSITVVSDAPPDAPSSMIAWDDVGIYTGPIENDSTTDDAMPRFYVEAGTALPDFLVTIYDNGVVIGQTRVQLDGSWSFTPGIALAQGAHSITTTLTSLAGNTSAPSARLNFTVDTMPPAQPTFGAGGITHVDDNVGAIQGNIAPNGTTDDTKPTFRGIGTPHDLITIIDNGTSIGTAMVDSKGLWFFTPSQDLAEGLHNITTTVTDPAGNASVQSEPYPIIVDTTSPAAPSMGLAWDDVGVTQGDIADKGITDDTQPELKGTAEAGSMVIIYDRQVELGRTVARADGTWRLTPTLPLSLGEHVLTSTATDAAGNTSEVSAAYSFTVVGDAIPRVPAIVTVYDNVLANLGYLQKEQVTNDSTPEISGTAQAGLTVRIYDNNTLLGSTLVDQYGNWSFTPTTPLTQGRHVFTADAINPVNSVVSDKTGDFAVVIDVTAPAAPEAMTALDNVGAEQGWIANNSTTDDATPTFSGTGTEGDLITIFDLGTSIGSALVNRDGVWFFTPEPSLIDGLHRITSTATDPAGNTSEQSPSLDFTVDTSAVVIALDAVYDDVGMYQGPIAPNGVTDDNLPRISGKAIPGSTVDVYDTVDGVSTKIGTVGVNALGNWVLTPATALVDGQHRITATSTYLGNVSAPTSAFDFTVDTTPPAKPGSGTGGISNAYDDVGSIQGYVAPNGVTDDATPTFSGTGTAGDLITIRDDGTVIGTAIVKPDGSWSFTPRTPLTEGPHDITTTVTDPAGNTSVPSDPYPLIVDTRVDRLVATLLKDSGLGGDLLSDRITNVKTVNVSGFEEGAMWQWKTLTGSWSSLMDTSSSTFDLLTGENGYRVRQIDRAGNVSEWRSTAWTFTYDYVSAGLKTRYLGAFDRVIESAADSVASGNPNNTVLSNGNTVVVWQSKNALNQEDVYAQIFGIDGQAFAPAFKINTLTQFMDDEPAVAALKDGGFVVTWEKKVDADPYTGRFFDIFARQYDAFGAAVTDEFLVNGFTRSEQSFSEVTGLQDGGYVIVWQNNVALNAINFDISAQRYNKFGEKVGAEQQIHLPSALYQGLPIVTGLADGGYVVVWQSDAQDGSGSGIYVRQYNSSGQSVFADDLLVNTTTEEGQYNPAVTQLAGGGYLIAWTSPDSSGLGVFGQKFDGQGNRVGGEIRLSANIDGDQFDPTIYGLASGGFVVVYQDQNQSKAGTVIHANIYNAQGVVISDFIVATSYSAGDQINPFISGKGDMWTVTWEGPDQNGKMTNFRKSFDAQGHSLLVSSANTAPTQLVDTAFSASKVDSSFFLEGSGFLGGAILSFKSGYVAGDDVFSFHGKTAAQIQAEYGITTEWDSVSGKLTLYGKASIAQYSEVISLLEYDHLSTHIAAQSDKIIVYEVADVAGNRVKFFESAVHVVATEDAPVIHAMPDANASIAGSDAMIDVALLMGQNQTIQLGQFSSVEKVDITGSGANTLTVTLEDVLNISNGNSTMQKTQVCLTVIGDADDTVNLVNTAQEQWSTTGRVVHDGQFFHVYHRSDVLDPLADLWIKDQVQVNFV